MLWLDVLHHSSHVVVRNMVQQQTWWNISVELPSEPEKKKYLPSALLVHCLHPVWICLHNAAKKVNIIKGTLNLITEISQLIRCSPNHSVILTDIKEKFSAEAPAWFKAFLSNIGSPHRLYRVYPGESVLPPTSKINSAIPWLVSLSPCFRSFRCRYS